MCVRQSRLETLHRGLSPITRTWDYSDVVVVDADGRRIPWPEVSRFDEDEMPELMREIVNKIYTFFVKAEDPDFQAVSRLCAAGDVGVGQSEDRFRDDASCEGIRPWSRQERLKVVPNAGVGWPVVLSA